MQTLAETKEQIQDLEDRFDLHVKSSAKHNTQINTTVGNLQNTVGTLSNTVGTLSNTVSSYSSAISGKEDKTNKVTSLNNSCTDVQYPSAKCVYDGLATKQNALTFDNTPTSASQNPVTSGGVYAALSNKQNVLTFDNAPTQNSTNPTTSGAIFDALSTKQNVLTFDVSPTSASTNPVTSGGVYSALQGKQDTLTFDNAPTNASQNPVTSGGVYTALSNKQNSLTFDDTPTQNSTNPVKSGGVYAELSTKENSSNKVTSISSNSTDAQYPSAKCVYDELATKQNTLTAGTNISIENGVISASGGGGGAPTFYSRYINHFSSPVAAARTYDENICTFTAPAGTKILITMQTRIINNPDKTDTTGLASIYMRINGTNVINEMVDKTTITTEHSLSYVFTATGNTDTLVCRLTSISLSSSASMKSVCVQMIGANMTASDS
ncbi:MAG: hypothetical protein IJU58_02900 [Clostridia bacterium]|nr:hypothetical protein [Clostridia bacterium]